MPEGFQDIFGAPDEYGFFEGLPSGVPMAGEVDPMAGYRAGDATWRPLGQPNNEDFFDRIGSRISDRVNSLTNTPNISNGNLAQAGVNAAGLFSPIIPMLAGIFQGFNAFGAPDSTGNPITDLAGRPGFLQRLTADGTNWVDRQFGGNHMPMNNEESSALLRSVTAALPRSYLDGQMPGPTGGYSNSPNPAQQSSGISGWLHDVLGRIDGGISSLGGDKTDAAPLNNQPSQTYAPMGHPEASALLKSVIDALPPDEQPAARPQPAQSGAQPQPQPDPASQPWQGQGSMADLMGVPWFQDTRDMAFPNFMAGAGFGGAGYGYGASGGGGGADTAFGWGGMGNGRSDKIGTSTSE